MSRNNLSHRLRFEALENRQMLAGDIDARAIGNVLYITGDDLPQSVVIHSTSDGVIQVLGLSQDETPTTVNGKESESFVRIKDIVVDLEGGDDTLVLTDLALSGSASLRMGEGDDVIGFGEFDIESAAIENLVQDVLGTLTIKGVLNIAADSGSDTLMARNTSLGVSLIDLGDDGDTLSFEQSGEPEDSDYVPGVSTTGTVTINLGDGQNSAAFKGLEASLVLTAGDEQDTLVFENSTVAKSTDILAGDGANHVSVENFQGKSLGIALGVGNDMVTLSDVTTSGRTVIGDGFGDDTLTITDVQAKSLGVSMGVGNDTLSITSATIAKSLDLAAGDGDDIVTLIGIIGKSLDLWLDAGNDNLSLQEYLAIAKKLSLSGGDGNDSIDVDGATAATLNVVLGAGDDDLTLDHVIIGKKVKLDGAQGINTYTDAGANTLPKLKSKNFQNEA